MQSTEYIYYLFFGSIVLLAVLIVLIARSDLKKNTKILLYVLSVISPFTGLILYLIFIYRDKRRLRSTEA